MTKSQTKYKEGERVLYSSLSTSKASHGTILSADNETDTHLYTIEPDEMKGKQDVVKERDIYYTV